MKKERRKRYILLAVTMFLCIILLAGCFARPDYVILTGLYEPYYILNADMPFADHMNTTQFDTVRKLETDSYGRCYYSYTTPSIAYQYGDLKIHVISQKETETDIYYYPDYCYIAREPKEGEFSEEEIARLKELNDWDKPLDEARMRRLPNDSQKEIISNTDLEAILHDYLSINEGYDLFVHGLEINEKNQQMFFCEVFNIRESAEQEHIATDYILVYQNSSSQPIVAIEEIEHSLSCQDVVHNFRLTWFEPEQGQFVSADEG